MSPVDRATKKGVGEGQQRTELRQRSKEMMGGRREGRTRGKWTKEERSRLRRAERKRQEKSGRDDVGPGGLHVLGEEPDHTGAERLNTLGPLTAEPGTLIRTRKRSEGSAEPTLTRGPGSSKAQANPWP